MMLKVVLSNQFKRDLKLSQKRGYNLDLLNEIVDKLANQESLDEKYKDHALTGKYRGFRECHIEPDWLLVYRINEDEIFLYLSRIGTHSDLF